MLNEDFIPNVDEENKKLDILEKMLNNALINMRELVYSTHKDLQSMKNDIEQTILPLIDNLIITYHEKKYNWLKTNINKLIKLIEMYNVVAREPYDSPTWVLLTDTRYLDDEHKGALKFPLINYFNEKSLGYKWYIVPPLTNKRTAIEGLGIDPMTIMNVFSLNPTNLAWEVITNIPQVKEQIQNVLNTVKEVFVYGYKDLEQRAKKINAVGDNLSTVGDNLLKLVTNLQNNVTSITNEIKNIVDDISAKFENINKQPEPVVLPAETKKEIISEKVVNTGKYYGRAGEHYEYTTRADIPLIMPMDRKPAVSGYDIAGVYDREITKIKNSINLSHLRRS